MATYPCLGTGPISFLDSNQAQQAIPLSSIVFGANGPDASAWPAYPANKVIVDALLKNLWNSGLIAPNTQTSLAESLSIQAVQPGVSGNSISVTFSNPKPKAGTMTIAATGTEVYAGLTPTAIGTTLGTSAAAATGLVYVQSQAGTDPMPQAPFSGSISGGICAVPASGVAGDAFTLAATDSTYTGINIGITLDPSGTTFTLTVSGTKSVDDVVVANLGTTNPFSLLVKFTVPAKAPLPAPGSVTLTGGAAATSTPIEAATANVYS